MDTIVQTVVQHLQVGDALLKRALEGLSEEEINRRCGPDSSPIIWIVGHLVSSRYGILELAGEAVEVPSWRGLFSKGAKVGEVQAYPPLADILVEWDKVTSRMKEVCAALTREKLSMKPHRPFPVGDTVREAIAFLSWHEGYHIGQIALLRRWLGHSQLVG